MMANAHMSIFDLGINWNFLPNSPPNSSFSVHSFYISERPCSSIALNCIQVRKSLNFVRRKPKFSTACSNRVIKALGNGEVEAHSSSVQLIEKELKFNPTFQDYLKVMESVKTDGSIAGQKKRSMGSHASRKAREKPDSKSRRHGDDERRVESVRETETLGKRSNNLKDVKHSSNKGLTVTIDARYSERVGKERVGSNELRNHGRSKKKLETRSGVRFSEIPRSGSYPVENYDKKVIHVSNRNELKQTENKPLYDDKVERKTIEFEDGKNLQNRTIINRSSAERRLDVSLIMETSNRTSSFSRTNATKKSDDSFSRIEHKKTEGSLNGSEINNFEKEIDRQNVSRRYMRVHDDNRITGKVGSRAIETQGYAKRNAQSDGIDVEERAAFKTFEVFTDVQNRPRVLRMEMEERIQKLAKWLNATDINMPEWQFSKMIHSAKIKFTEHSILRVVQILGGLGNWKRALQVVEWLQSRERFKSYKSRYIYTSALDVLGKAKRPVEALNIFYAMREELSSYPDLAAYHCISVTLGQAGLMKELFDVIDCMRAAPEKKFKLGSLQKWDPRLEPDLVIYNAVLNACVQQKKWEGAFWVLQQLKLQNIRPTNTTLGLIMEVMLESGKYSLVHEFFRKVEKTSIPSALNYKVLVNTLWREGKIDEAVLAVKDMERRGVVGFASIYYDLARCLCTAGRCQEALLQIDKICKVAKKPLVVTYTGLIQACLGSGSIDNATYIFNEMHKFCSPNTITCNIMLKSYVHHGMYEEAKDLFQKILDGSHQIRSKDDSDQKANPDKFTFNTMMDMCAAKGNWDDFQNAYEQMLYHGFHFDARRHLRLVLDAFRAGKRSIIESTWDYFIRSERAPPPPIIQERFCIKLEEDDLSAAISCINKTHQEKEMHAFSEKAWLNLLKKNAHRFKDNAISRLTREVNQLVKESDRPSSTYRNLLNACTELAEITNHALT